MKKLIVLAAVLAFIQPAPFLGAAESPVKSTTIAGFINSDQDARNNSLNIVIIKSLLSTFAGLYDAKITPYEELEKKTADSWKAKKLSQDDAVRIAQYFGSRQVIFGDYTADRKKNSITVRVRVVDVVTGQLSLERTYTTSGNAGIFKTIDRMAENLVGLLSGTDVTGGILVIRAVGTRRTYDVYLNGQLKAKITAPGDTRIRSFVNADIEVSIRHSDTAAEAFRRQIRLREKQVTEIEFRPSGNLIVKNMLDPVEIVLNGEPAGTMNRNGEKTFPVAAYTHNSLEARRSDTIVLSTNVILNEGENKVVVFLQESAPVPVPAAVLPARGPEYAGLSPAWDLLVPGLVQIQAGDGWPGMLFFTAALAGVGLTAVSAYGLALAADPANRSPDNSYVTQWTWLLSGGLACWLCSAGFSTWHAAVRFGGQKKTLRPDTAALTVSFRF